MKTRFLLNVIVGLFLNILGVSWICADYIEDYHNSDYVTDYKNSVYNEFSLQLTPGRNECFYQSMTSGNYVFVVIEVRDKVAADSLHVTVKNGHGEFVVNNKSVVSTVEHHEMQTFGGIYEICIYTIASGWPKVLVTIGCHKKPSWDRYFNEVHDIGVKYTNFSGILRNVDERILEMRKFTKPDRDAIYRDFNQLLSKEKYIMFWSIGQAILIVAAAITQVHVLRNFFQDKNRNIRP